MFLLDWILSIVGGGQRLKLATVSAADKEEQCCRKVSASTIIKSVGQSEAPVAPHEELLKRFQAAPLGPAFKLSYGLEPAMWAHDACRID